MKNKYDFDFDDKVEITDLKLKGYVTAILLTPEQVKYQIRYIFNGEIKEVFFTKKEIELVPKVKDPLGFHHTTSDL